MSLEGLSGCIVLGVVFKSMFWGQRYGIVW